MYSFNLDYIFNLVYNLFLGIRYVLLFWVLRIDKQVYLDDHKFDTIDGLRDRGWLVDKLATSTTPMNGVTYLGNSADTNLSWWGVIKEKLFGIHTGNISTDSAHGFTPENVNKVIDQTNNSSWFSHLKFSIQNPILGFLADLLSVLSFFLVLLLIYILIKWFFIAGAPIFEKKQKKREEIMNAEKERKERREAEVEKLKEVRDVKILTREEKITIYKEESVEELLPAGIFGLPIDEGDLTENEVNEIDSSGDILSNYKFKNILPKKENTILKIENYSNVKRKEEKLLSQEIDNTFLKSKLSTEESLESSSVVKSNFQHNSGNDLRIYTNKDKESKNEKPKMRVQDIADKNKVKILREEEKKDWYITRWNIVIGYLEGEEEALWRIGILEADNLLNELLIDKGYNGNTLADRLTQANFKTIDLAWSGHKMRNRIAHEGSKFILTDRMARATTEDFRAVLTELGAFE